MTRLASASFACELVLAANIMSKLNARTNSGQGASWTVDDLLQSAGSFAAEDHTDGVCPVCRKTVGATSIGNIVVHFDTFNRTCVASGFEFHVAVET